MRESRGVNEPLNAILTGLRRELSVPKPYWLHASYIPASAAYPDQFNYHLLVWGPTGDKPGVIVRMMALEDGLNAWRRAYPDEKLPVDLIGETLIGIFNYSDPGFVELIQSSVNEAISVNERRRQ